MSAGAQPCGARRARWQETPPLVVARMPCARPAGHGGPHEDALGQEWTELPQDLVDAVAVTCAVYQVREAFAAEDEGAAR
ncbi:hypothetical protein GL263_15200 [Streptomyces durbertensis]|uniref:Uncharacterized protein n=1 Tax=Streptomyces durbertensis TaxID=2448886 RepID=A0ABR6EHT5_9ACTN|nr:hypothetical protein [Streptomyces durbertensis]MBB1244901.1 hypothetical protein [Streptomyces durbertensis]